jgi:hypothetical protein
MFLSSPDLSAEKSAGTITAEGKNLPTRGFARSHRQIQEVERKGGRILEPDGRKN